MQLRDGDRKPGRAFSGGAAAPRLLSGALCCFGLIALAVHHDWLLPLDQSILLAFRTAGNPSVPAGPKGLVSFMRDVTSLGSFAVLSSTVLAVSGYLALNGHSNRALALLGYTIGGTLLGEGAKHLFSRVRPDAVPHLVDVVTLSFPSAHAMQSFVVWFTVAMMLAEEQSRSCVRIYVFAVAGLVSLAVGISRIYFGVHWPTDVLAGWCLGLAWVVGCWWLDRRVSHRRGSAAEG